MDARVDGVQATNPYERARTRLSVLIATMDADVRSGLGQILRESSIKTVCVKAVAEVRTALARETFAACFSGFWLVDGTYRDVFRHLKRSALAAPLVLVCGPSCPNKYKDYLHSLNIRAFDFICHPYGKADLERILQSAIGKHPETAGGREQFPDSYPWTLQVGQRYPVKA